MMDTFFIFSGETSKDSQQAELKTAEEEYLDDNLSDDVSDEDEEALDDLEEPEQ